jgi:hypothetical protein
VGGHGEPPLRPRVGYGTRLTPAPWQGYTLGSVVWVINGFLSFLPFVTSMQKDPVGTGWSAWVGATIFAFASWLLIWEAWNRYVERVLALTPSLTVL